MAAMDAFNYALDNYYDTNLRNELQLWRAKTLLKLGNTQLARKKLTQIAHTPEKNPIPVRGPMLSFRKAFGKWR